TRWSLNRRTWTAYLNLAGRRIERSWSSTVLCQISLRRVECEPRLGLFARPSGYDHPGTVFLRHIQSPSRRAGRILCTSRGMNDTGGVAIHFRLLNVEKHQ